MAVLVFIAADTRTAAALSDQYSRVI